MSEAASLSRDQNKANDFALTFIDTFMIRELGGIQQLRGPNFDHR